MENILSLPIWINGITNLSWWEHTLVALGLTHMTIISVTIYLHRYSAHRSLHLSPLLTHFFRFWLWMTTGMSTKGWTATHRKHHAKCESPDDPHSPKVYGIKKVLFEGSELYRAESINKATLKKYGHGTPNDWIENNIYTPRSTWGVGLMLITNLVLFGPVGLSIWAVQMLWIPITAAGVINGIGHYWGYRNFQTEDASTNIIPWGILIGGEELHNNHHAYASSARLSSKWYEFDVGWMYIQIFSFLKLARVRKVAPRVSLQPTENECSVETLRSVIFHRYEVLARFTQSIKTTFNEEINTLVTSNSCKICDWGQFKNWLHGDLNQLEENERITFQNLLNNSAILKTLYVMRQDLSNVWRQSTLTKEQLLEELETWCKKADQSGIVPLTNFSKLLRGYS